MVLNEVKILGLDHGNKADGSHPHLLGLELIKQQMLDDRISNQWNLCSISEGVCLVLR
jgi:hypothetical protein